MADKKGISLHDVYCEYDYLSAYSILQDIVETCGMEAVQQALLEIRAQPDSKLLDLGAAIIHQGGERVVREKAQLSDEDLALYNTAMEVLANDVERVKLYGLSFSFWDNPVTNEYLDALKPSDTSEATSKDLWGEPIIARLDVLNKAIDAPKAYEQVLNIKGVVYLRTVEQGLFAPILDDTKLVGTFTDEAERDEIVGRLMLDYQDKYIEQLELDDYDRERGVVACFRNTLSERKINYVTLNPRPKRILQLVQPIYRYRQPPLPAQPYPAPQDARR